MVQTNIHISTKTHTHTHTWAHAHHPGISMFLIKTQKDGWQVASVELGLAMNRQTAAEIKYGQANTCCLECVG